MKKVFALTLAVVLALGLFACGKGEDNQVTTTEPTIITTDSTSITTEAIDNSNFPVVIYLPDHAAIDAGGCGFVTKEEWSHDAIDTVHHLVRLLVQYGALPEGVEVLSYTKGTLDMNAAFAEALSHTGAIGEALLMGCLVNTMLTYLGLDSITITAEGQTLQTGHDTYDYPLTFYD